MEALKPRVGANKRRKRVGRGTSSGFGKTSGRGGKGQTARNGGNIPARFEGGQWPLYRRIPKRGFKNPFRHAFNGVNVGLLASAIGEGLLTDAAISLASLKSAGLLPKNAETWKLLGKTKGQTGSFAGKKIVADAVSENARKLVEAAGATVEVIVKKSKVLKKGKKKKE